jgi:hypothetical protein
MEPLNLILSASKTVSYINQFSLQITEPQVFCSSNRNSFSILGLGLVSTTDFTVKAGGHTGPLLSPDKKP